MSNSLALRVQGTDTSISVAVKRVFNGGYSGSDQEKVQKHIDEVKALGAPAPTTTPVLYPLPNNLVTTAESLQVQHDQTSGEIEYVLIWAEGQLFVTVGSDHTDRKIESHSVHMSKQMYPNIIAPEIWRFEDIHHHWNQVELECWAVIDGRRQLYQKGTLADLMAPKDWEKTFADYHIKQDGTIFFAGTINALTEEMLFANAYELGMRDPIRGRSISHSYALEMLPAAIE